MTFVQAWSLDSSSSVAPTDIRTGSATTAGSTLLVAVAVRDNTITSVSVTDNGSGGTNEWETLVTMGTGFYVLVCRDAEPITQITASWFDASSAPVASEHIVHLSEHSDVGEVIGTPVSEETPDGGLPTTTSVTAGQLLWAFGGWRGSNRSWTLASSGVTATERASGAMGQMTLLVGDAYAAASGSAAIGWDRANGSSETPLWTMNVLFDGPSVLSVGVDGSTSGYVGVPSAVTCAATGGSGTKAYAWTTNASGTFANASAASTTYTPNATGEHILNCAVTDASGTDDDSLAFNASAIPTEDFSAASGWTTVVGTSRLAAISDDDDDTYVQTGDDPVGEAFTLTLPAMQRRVGDLIVPLRLSATAGDVAVVPSLVVYDAGPTARTVTAATITVSGGVANYAATFTAAQLADTINWNTGLVLTLTATAV